MTGKHGMVSWNKLPWNPVSFFSAHRNFISEEIKKLWAPENPSVLSANISVTFVPPSFSLYPCPLPLSPSWTLFRLLLKPTQAQCIHLMYVHTFGVRICRGGSKNITTWIAFRAKLSENTCSGLAPTALHTGAWEEDGEALLKRGAPFCLLNAAVSQSNEIDSEKKASLIKWQPAQGFVSYS